MEDTKEAQNERAERRRAMRRRRLSIETCLRDEVTYDPGPMTLRESAWYIAGYVAGFANGSEDGQP